jgi:predicted RNA-binding protein with PIN domain
VPAPDLKLLHPAFDAARRALAGMETVPSGLRRVAATTDRHLAPPLARRLQAELEDKEWLRLAALAELPESSAASPPWRASALFLARPEGWQEEMSSLLEVIDQQHAATRLSDLQRRLDEVTAELEATKQKLKTARRRPGPVVPATTKPPRASKPEPERPDRRLGEVIAERDALAGQVASLTAQLERGKKVVTKLRTSRRISPPEREHAAVPSPWARRDPAALAAFLDDLMTSLSVTPQPGSVAGVTRERRRLPKGMAPDQPESLEWLSRQERGGLLVVDGYNVGFVLREGSTPNAATRAVLAGALAQWSRTAVARWKVVIVYDSAVASGKHPAPRGVEVQFVPSADDAVVELASRWGRMAVVVTSDRAVREAAESHQSLGLWAEALAAWITHYRRGRRR